MAEEGIRAWIYRQAYHGRITFTMDELRCAYPSMPQSALHSALYRAVKRREIAIAWQGFYIILPLEYRGVGSMPPCEYIDKLMQYLKKPYCVALLNAAEMYGAAHQHPMNFTVMTSDPPPRCSQRRDVRIEFVSKRRMNNGIPPELVRRVKTQYGAMNITTPEFTALTLLQYEHATGGLSNVLTVLSELLDVCRFNSLPPSITAFVPATCFRRLGYMMDRLLHKTSAANALHRFVSATGLTSHRACLHPGMVASACPFDDKWKLYINTQLQSDLDDTRRMHS